LAPLTDYKIGDVQPVEIFFVLSFLILLIKRKGSYKFRVPPWLASHAKQYFYFGLAVLLTSLLALRLKSYPPPDTSLLKQAPILSLARLIQLSLSIVGALYLSNLIYKDKRLAAQFARTYCIVGLTISIYSIASWIALHFGIDLGGAYRTESIRARGTFVEGGPLGVYLDSVLVVAFYVKVSRGKDATLKSIFYLVTVGAALMLSASKAGILLALSLLVLSQLFMYRSTFRKLVSIFAALTIATLAAFVLPNLVSGLAAYASAYDAFDTYIQLHPDDPNVVNGRIMGMVLVPKMTLAHPLFGVGLGDYSLQRNNPTLLDGLPTTPFWDLPGLGLASYAPELGLPIFVWLCWLLVRPVRLALMLNASRSFVAVTLYQSLAEIFGAQLTFAYPWLVSAFATGLLLAVQSEESSPNSGRAVDLRDSRRQMLYRRELR
jgi:hypothetical protein